jgi:hypothetical protein
VSHIYSMHAVYCARLLFLCGYLWFISSGPFRGKNFMLVSAFTLLMDSGKCYSLVITFWVLTSNFLVDFPSFFCVRTFWNFDGSNFQVWDSNDDKVLVGELRVKTLSWTLGGSENNERVTDILDISVLCIKLSSLQIAFSALEHGDTTFLKWSQARKKPVLQILSRFIHTSYSSDGGLCWTM